MFDATRLLGGLISSGLGRRGRSFLPSMGTVAGIAGVAAVGGISYAAYKHYQAGGFGQGGPGLFGGAPQQPAPGGFGGSPGGFGGSPGGFGEAPMGGFSPPAFTTTEGAGFGQAGPPIPPQAAPAPSAATPPADAQAQALLLVRAMIAAANIDGAIDADERQRILQGAEQAGFGAAEREALERELAAPHPPRALLAQAADAELAAQLYLVTLLAIQIDSDIERTYARALPLILQVPAARVAEIHTQLGVSAP